MMLYVSPLRICALNIGKHDQPLNWLTIYIFSRPLGYKVVCELTKVREICMGKKSDQKVLIKFKRTRKLLPYLQYKRIKR